MGICGERRKVEINVSSSKTGKGRRVGIGGGGGGGRGVIGQRVGLQFTKRVKKNKAARFGGERRVRYILESCQQVQMKCTRWLGGRPADPPKKKKPPIETYAGERRPGKVLRNSFGHGERARPFIRKKRKGEGHHVRVRPEDRWPHGGKKEVVRLDRRKWARREKGEGTEMRSRGQNSPRRGQRYTPGALGRSTGPELYVHLGGNDQNPMWSAHGKGRSSGCSPFR